MSYQRRFNLEWTSDCLHSYCVRIEDSALRLVQEAEGEHQDDVVDFIAEQIEDAIKGVVSLFKKSTRQDLSGAFDFKAPVIEAIPSDMNIRVRDLCGKFERKVSKIFSKKSDEEMLADLPLAQLAIMNLILEIRRKVKDFEMKIEKVESVEVTEEEINKLPENVQSYVRTILHFLGSPFPSPMQLRPIINIIKEGVKIKIDQNIAKEIGLQVDLTKFLKMTNPPACKKNYNIYRKIRNWIIEHILKFARSRNKDLLKKISENLE